MGLLPSFVDRWIDRLHEQWKARWWFGGVLVVIASAIWWIMRRAGLFEGWDWAEITLAAIAAAVAIMFVGSLVVFAYYLVRPKPRPSPVLPSVAVAPPPAAPDSPPHRLPEVQAEKPREIHFLVRKHYLLDCLRRLKSYEEEFEALTKSYLERCKRWREPPADASGARLMMSGETRNPPDPDEDFISSRIKEMEADVNAMFDDVTVKLSDAPAHLKNDDRPLPEADGCDPAARKLFSFASARRDHAQAELRGVAQRVDGELRSVWETLSDFGRHSS